MTQLTQLNFSAMTAVIAIVLAQIWINYSDLHALLKLLLAVVIVIVSDVATICVASVLTNFATDCLFFLLLKDSDYLSLYKK